MVLGLYTGMCGGGEGGESPGETGVGGAPGGDPGGARGGGGSVGGRGLFSMTNSLTFSTPNPWNPVVAATLTTNAGEEAVLTTISEAPSATPQSISTCWIVGMV